MPDRRRPTDGELFRTYRPGVGQPADPKPAGKPWRSPGLKGDRASLSSLSKRTLNDLEAYQFVQDSARWLNKPHGLTRGSSDRSSTDQALRKLLYGMSDGEAEFLLQRLRTRARGTGGGARTTTTKRASTRSAAGVEPYADDAVTRPRSKPQSPSRTVVRAEGERDATATGQLAGYLTFTVPRPEAIAIVRLIALGAGTDAPDDLAADFAGATARFTRRHLVESRAEELLRALQDRAAAGEAWIRPDRQARLPG